MSAPTCGNCGFATPIDGFHFEWSNGTPPRLVHVDDAATEEDAGRECWSVVGVADGMVECHQCHLLSPATEMVLGERYLTLQSGYIGSERKDFWFGPVRPRTTSTPHRAIRVKDAPLPDDYVVPEGTSAVIIEVDAEGDQVVLCTQCLDALYPDTRATGYGRGQRGRKPRRGARRVKATVTAATREPDRLDSLRTLLVDGPKTTAEMAEALGIEQRSVQRLMKGLDLTSTRDGKSIRWSLKEE